VIYCAISGLWPDRPIPPRLPGLCGPVIHAASGYDLAHIWLIQGRGTPGKDTAGISHPTSERPPIAFGARSSRRFITVSSPAAGQMIDVFDARKAC